MMEERREKLISCRNWNLVTIDQIRCVLYNCDIDNLIFVLVLYLHILILI